MSEEQRFSTERPDSSPLPESPADRTASIVPLTTRRRAHAVPPTPATTLVGRMTELSAVREALGHEHVRLLTLTGPGGIGKTRLALEFAAREMAAFLDGIVWMPLSASREEHHMLSAVEAALGITDVHGTSTLEPVISALRNQEMLLILDNFEQIVATAPLVATILHACPLVRILVTSRSPLHLSGERILALPPLVLPASHDRLSPSQAKTFEAVQLFVDRAESVLPTFQLD